ncbi:MAG: 1-acyl-sn-glycerol-3-phosphate acyltransferase [Prevotella sp.]|nr:1-acyl-sn-glycerol-3-phosphate acyltransferase [Prevotellaceae bacterium]MDY3936550.1 1-acyl-sn-glycerol-3-phosphate acyltransferase [Prevotella sp.]
MLKNISSWLLYKVMGWSVEVSVEFPQKYIICIAPHTSNWDFIIGQLYNQATGLGSNFLMKKEWFVGPLGWCFRRLGGIPVNRSKKTSMTDQLAQYAIQSDSFKLAITPEGTRSLNPDWKKGFYFIALKAQIPILLCAIDYPTKRIVCTKTILPSGDLDKDMTEIKCYYKDFKGKHPHLFSIGEI